MLVEAAKMNLSQIKAAQSSGTEIEITIADVGTLRGVPRISWKKSTVTLKQANGCKSVVSFEDIQGF